MSYKLFLDDIRTPPTNEWVVVRNFRQFTETIRNNGNPHTISFDHDLGEDMHQYRLTQGIYTKRKSRSLKKLELTGYDCAKWYMEYIKKNHLPKAKIYIHSANPSGSENIKSIVGL